MRIRSICCSIFLKKYNNVRKRKIIKTVNLSDGLPFYLLYLLQQRLQQLFTVCCVIICLSFQIYEAENMEQKTDSVFVKNPNTATGADYDKNKGLAELRDYSSKGKKKRFWFF